MLSNFRFVFLGLKSHIVCNIMSMKNVGDVMKDMDDVDFGQENDPACSFPITISFLLCSNTSAFVRQKQGIL